ncbi:hypothetical protein D3C78_730020 [compost metagenome]
MCAIESRRMVHQHTGGDLLVSFVGHCELGNVLQQWPIYIQLACIGKHHCSGGHVHFANGADPEHRILRNKRLLSCFIHSEATRKHDFPFVSNCILNTVCTVAADEPLSHLERFRPS